MAPRGRPVERPAHPSNEQRRRAPGADAGVAPAVWAKPAGDGRCGSALATPVIARGKAAGMTMPGLPGMQADQLDKALQRLLADRYVEGEAFDIWGWPRQQDMSYDRVVELLRSAGFDVPRLGQIAASPRQSSGCTGRANPTSCTAFSHWRRQPPPGRAAGSPAARRHFHERPT